MRGQHIPLRRSDYEQITQCLKSGKKSGFDIRLETGISRSEWHTRRRDMLALGLLRQEGRVYVGGDA
jgi:hypothetical protein